MRQVQQGFVDCREDLGFIQEPLGSLGGCKPGEGGSPICPSRSLFPSVSATHRHPHPVPSAGVGVGVHSLPSPRPAPARPPPTLPTSEAPRSRTVCCKPRNVSPERPGGNVGGEEGKGGEPREESRGDTDSRPSAGAGPGSTQANVKLLSL